MRADTEILPLWECALESVGLPNMRHVPDIALVLGSIFSRLHLRRSWDHRRSLAVGEWYESSGGWILRLGSFDLRLSKTDAGYSMQMADYGTRDAQWDDVTHAVIRDDVYGPPSSVNLDRAKQIAAGHGLHRLEVTAALAIADASLLREAIGGHQL